MRGASLVELLVAMALVAVVAAGVVGLMREAAHASTAQPAAADLVQRLRAVRLALEADLLQAGAGLTRVAVEGPLGRWLPPVFPRRIIPGAADPDTQAFDDRLTVLAVPDGALEAPIDAMDWPGAPLVPAPGPWCEAAEPACGFRDDRALLVVDSLARFALVIDPVILPAAVQPPVILGAAFDVDPLAAEVHVVSYRFDAGRRQLRRALSGGRELPVVDDVVGFAVEYLGDPFPPLAPQPPLGVATCVIDVDGRARLPVLAPTDGALVRLDVATLWDGPWCGVEPYRFDADLYRVRRIRIRVRLQSDAAESRGRDVLRFARPGTAREPGAEVPDLALVLDVAPANLQVP